MAFPETHRLEFPVFGQVYLNKLYTEWTYSKSNAYLRISSNLWTHFSSYGNKVMHTLMHGSSLKTQLRPRHLCLKLLYMTSWHRKIWHKFLILLFYCYVICPLTLNQHPGKTLQYLTNCNYYELQWDAWLPSLITECLFLLTFLCHIPWQSDSKAWSGVILFGFQETGSANASTCISTHRKLTWSHSSVN